MLIPQKGETREAFLVRWVADRAMCGEFPEEGRRQAAGLAQFSRHAMLEAIRSLRFEGDKVSASASLRKGMTARLALAPKTLEELRPSGNDFLRRDFRALSASVIQAEIGFWPMMLDLTADGLLEGATPLMDRLVVYLDHDKSADRWQGVIERAWFEEGDPSGINVTVAIDWRARPETARGLLIGAIRSGSLSFDFSARKSHPGMDEFTFLDMQGRVVDDELVRLIVESIDAGNEFSLVWSGADPDARVLEVRQDEAATGAASLRRGGSPRNDRRKKMGLKERLSAKLGLDSSASDEIVVEKVGGLMAELEAGKKVGEALERRATKAELELAALSKAALEEYMADLKKKSAAANAPISEERLEEIRQLWDKEGRADLARKVGDAELRASGYVEGIAATPPASSSHETSLKKPGEERTDDERRDLARGFCQAMAMSPGISDVDLVEDGGKFYAEFDSRARGKRVRQPISF